MIIRTLIALAALTFASQASAIRAMSVLTIHAEDPAGYVKWSQESGPAIGKSVGADAAGVCRATAGYSAPGELYYWHTFRNQAEALSADTYNDTVMNELKKLDVERTVSQADAFSLVMAQQLILAEGDSFSNWNLVIHTDDAVLYQQQLNRINDAASENGFEDVSLTAYSFLTSDQAGNLLVIVQAPTPKRLGAFMDQLNSGWMAPIMSGLAGIRHYVSGVIMNCKVVYVAS